MLYLVTSTLYSAMVRILDTDDLYVEKIRREQFIELLQKNQVDVENVGLTGVSVLWVMNEHWHFYNYHNKIVMVNGYVVYERGFGNTYLTKFQHKDASGNIKNLSVFLYNDELCIGDNKVRIEGTYYNDSGQPMFDIEVVCNDISHNAGSIKLKNAVKDSGVDYIFRLADKIIVKYCIEVFPATRSISIVLDLNGNLVGVVFDKGTPVYSSGLDDVFLTKISMSQGY